MLRWMGRIFAVIGFIVCIGLLITALLFSKTGTRTRLTPNSVLHIKLDGRIFETEPAFNLQNLFEEKSTSLRSVVETIEGAKNDPNILGIVTEIKQPILGIAQIQEIRNALADFRESGKFTYAYTDTFGEFSPALSSYYLAAAHEKIWLQPLGHLCITGLNYEVPFARKLLEQWDINPQIGRRKEYKTALDSLTEFNMTPAHEESVSKVLHSLFDQMVAHISHDRALSPDAFKRLVDSAPIYDPNDAKKFNLIDSVGYFYDLEAYVREQHHPEARFIPLESYKETVKGLKKGTQSIAIIYASGEITRNDMSYNPLSEDMYVTPKSMEKAFKEALNDSTTKAIVFRVNSPGGSPIASEFISGQVKLAQKKGIPVIVSMSDVAGSGGYWISCYANKIIAQPATITGSIGVIGGKIATEKLWNRLGISFEGISIGQSAPMWSSVKPYDQEGWKKLQSWLDYIYDMFLNHVALGRALPLEHVREIAKGRIWSGEDAKKYGLVDELGGLNKAISVAKNEAKLSLADPIAIKEYPHSPSIIEKVLNLTARDTVVMKTIFETLHKISLIFERPSLKMTFDPEAIF